MPIANGHMPIANGHVLIANGHVPRCLSSFKYRKTRDTTRPLRRIVTTAHYRTNDTKSRIPLRNI